MLKPWRAVAVVGVASLASAFACGDAIHLDPDTSASSSSSSSSSSHTTSTTSGGADGGPVGCASNADCPFPTPICDTAAGICVGCLVFDDCTYYPGTVCSKGKCACPNSADTYCQNLDNSNPRCIDTKSAPTDCGSCNQACYGACTSGKCADAWTPTQTQGAPAARRSQVSVWTGSKMIIWGGNDGNARGDGAMYDPGTNTWMPMSGENAPSPRWDATAVWTGSVMIVWGGTNGGSALADGGVFDPAKNSWLVLPTLGAPTPRYQHTAVWTGSAMIVWGGQDSNGPLGDGATFDLSKNMWTTTITAASSPGPRYGHTAVWSGAQMIVFGGVDGMPGAGGGSPAMPVWGDGGRYNPSSNTWSLVNSAGAPSPRAFHSAVWTGTGMLVFGGQDGSNALSDAATYNPSLDSWSVPLNPGPEARENAVAAFFGMGGVGQFVVFGGDDAHGDVLGTLWSYDLTGAAWTQLPSGPPARTNFTGVVDDKKLIIWGGNDGGLHDDGGIFDTSFMP